MNVSSEVLLYVCVFFFCSLFFAMARNCLEFKLAMSKLQIFILFEFATTRKFHWNFKLVEYWSMFHYHQQIDFVITDSFGAISCSVYCSDIHRLLNAKPICSTITNSVRFLLFPDFSVFRTPNIWFRTMRGDLIHYCSWPFDSIFPL